MRTSQVFLPLVLVACAAGDKPAGVKAQHVDPAAAVKLLADQPDVQVLDVRTPTEFAAGHLKNAVNIDYKASGFSARLGKLDRSKKYLVYCRSGRRSTGALGVLTELGFHHQIHLDGGILAWQKASQPLVK
ncbi:MAG: rhodanese-like domain-containing protein [Planctomycetes bacterium]|nr:rhodanese-like domain-containing protein [Planctomycetota bacterium]